MYLTDVLFVVDSKVVNITYMDKKYNMQTNIIVVRCKR